MRLYQQLVVFMLAATVLPLAWVGFRLLSSAETELARRIGGEQRALARMVARDAAAQLMGAVESLGRATEAIDWTAATPEEIHGGLSLLYQQSDALAAVALLDAQGTLRAGPVFRRERDDGHPPFREDAQLAWLNAVPIAPLRGGQQGQAALGVAYGDPARGPLRLAVAVKGGAGMEAPFVLGELGLERVEARLAEAVAGQGARVELIDGNGRIIASSDPARRLVLLEPAIRSQLSAAAASTSATVESPHRTLVSVERVPDRLGLFAVVTEEAASALAPVAQMRQTVLLSMGLGLLILLSLGALFTRRLTRRINRVVVGAEAFGRGELSHRIAVDGGDELAALSGTFNRMGAELESARARLERWNDDLRQKVEEATAELRAAQAQLVEAQKLAAVGQLGAGVAHEINNPLAGILGNTQLLMLDRSEADPDFETLRKIELSAKRCKDITQNLLRFSQQRDRPELRRVNLHAIVRDAVSLTENQLRGDGIELVIELPEGEAPVNADPGHLSQVILAVVSNARTAMQKSARKVLTLRAELDEAEVRLHVQDTGKGISPEHLPRVFEPFFTTKDVWSNVGLGLSVAYRVMSEHQGHIAVTSPGPGEGALVTLRLPRHA